MAYDATNKRVSFTAETDGYLSQGNETLTHSIEPFFTYKLTFTVGGNPLKISL